MADTTQDVTRLRAEELADALELSQRLRKDPTMPTAVLLLCDMVPGLIEDALAVEQLKQEQLERFFGTTEIGAAA